MKYLKRVYACVITVLLTLSLAAQADNDPNAQTGTVAVIRGDYAYITPISGAGGTELKTSSLNLPHNCLESCVITFDLSNGNISNIRQQSSDP